MAKAKPVVTEPQPEVEADVAAVVVEPEPEPQPVAVFKYLPNAVVPSRYDSGVPVVLQFDADGVLKCYDFALRNAVWKATVDPDLPPGHISQVAA